jgi:hypothetical protein
MWRIELSSAPESLQVESTTSRKIRRLAVAGWQTYRAGGKTKVADSKIDRHRVAMASSQCPLAFELGVTSANPADHHKRTRRIDRKNRVAMWGRHSHLPRGHGGEFGKLHFKLGRAVQIEPCLRSQSPKSGSISVYGRRLSDTPGPSLRSREPRDRWPNCKSPPLAGLSASMRRCFAERIRTSAW